MKFARSLLILLALFSMTANAVAVKDLFTAQIDMPANSDHDYSLYIKPAFNQVLLKVTGSPEAENSFSKLTPAELQQAVKSYSYTQNKMIITFSSDVIRHWLSSAHIPMWGDDRPLLLVWLMQQEPSGTRLIPADENDSAAQMMTVLSQQYALPMELPLLDLNEVGKVSIETVQQQNWTTLNQVSERYHAVGHLIVTISQDPQSWQTSWTVRVGPHFWQWQQTGETLNDALSQGMQKLNQQLSHAYAVTQAETVEAVQVVINNVRDYSAYEKVLAHLKQLSPVRQIQIVEVAADRVVYELQLSGGAPAFQQALKSDALLEAVEESANLPLSLEYRLIS